MSDYRKLSDYAFEDRIVIPFHVFSGPLLLPVYLAFSKWYVLFSYSQTTLVKFNIGLNAKQLLLKSICAIFVKHWTVHNQSKLNCKIQFLCSNQNSTRKIGAFNYFAKFAGKNLSRSPFLIESQAFNLFRKETPARLFSCEFYEIFKNTCFLEHLRATCSEYAPSFRIFSTRKMSAAVVCFQCVANTQ